MIGRMTIAQRLPRRRAEVARGFFVAGVEAIEDREHDKEAERQRPGEMSAEAGGERPHRRLQVAREPVRPMVLEKVVEQAELERDPERGDDRGHDEARDRNEEQEVRALELLAEGEAGGERQQDGEDHHHHAELERTLERAADVDDAAAMPQAARTNGSERPFNGKVRPPVGPWNERMKMTIIGP